MTGKRPDGAIRRSQILSTAGPGALVDLVDNAVIINGPDDWRYAQETEGFITEPRLEALALEHLRSHRDPWPHSRVRLRLPPSSEDDHPDPRRGIHVRLFPAWFVCQRCNSLVHRDVLGASSRHSCTSDPRGPSGAAVPIRFLGSCAHGHLQDLHWRHWLHPGQRSLSEDERYYFCAIDPEHRQRRAELDWSEGADMHLQTIGTSGELAEQVLHCRRCGAKRGLQDLVNKREGIGRCQGWRPWLRHNDKACEQRLHLQIRAATNAWHPVNLSVLHLDEEDAGLSETLTRHWGTLQKLSDPARLRLVREMNLLADELLAAIAPYSDEQLSQAILERSKGGKTAERSPREPEWKALITADYGLPDDLPTRERSFVAHRLSVDNPPEYLDRIVLVKVLRIVTAQVGFLRRSAGELNAEGQLVLEVDRVAPLSEEADWIPAVEQRGEGIFFSLDEAALRRWEERPAVRARERRFRQALGAHNQEHIGADVIFGGARLLLLHSLSHMLIRAISLECGYSAAAIHERIYCYRAPLGEGPGAEQEAMAASRAGILLYTGTPGSEGTLGGLVEVGRRLLQHLEAALEMNRLCSSDPICAQHGPDHGDQRHREGAACHGCLYIAEPSCERMNHDLDRAFVVRTVEPESAETAFFG